MPPHLHDGTSPRTTQTINVETAALVSLRKAVLDRHGTTHGHIAREATAAILAHVKALRGE